MFESKCKYFYNVKACATVKRRGTLEAPGLVDSLNFSSPPEFQGDPGIWTPEHFLVGAVATCFVSTFKAMADYSRLEHSSLEVRGEGCLEKPEGGYKFTEIRLYPVLTIPYERDRERALRLLEKAEKSCLITRSLNCAVKVEPRLKVTELVPAD